MDRPKDRFIHQSAFLFYFFMTAEVLIVAAGSLLRHYLALRHPMFILMHIELGMYWGGSMNGDTMRSTSGNADADAGGVAGEDRYVWKEFPTCYIQDSEDTSRMVETTFPRLEGIGEYWMTPYDGAGDSFQSYSGSVQDGRYQLKRLFVKMAIPAKNLRAGGVTLGTIKVRYGDGTGEGVSTGQIILALDKPMEHATVTGGPSSSDGVSMVRYFVQKDCRLGGPGVQNPEQIGGEFKVTVDRTNIWEWEPAAMTKGGIFLVESTWRRTGDMRE